jgi:hypothetical protein
MDLHQYYEDIKTLEDTFQQHAVVVVSAATGDGGRAGIISEVDRHTAARLIVEGRATLATTDQIRFFSLWRQGPPAQPKVSTTNPPAVATPNHTSNVPRTRKR